MKEAAYKALYPSLPLIRASNPDFILSFHSFEMDHHKGVPLLRVLNHSSATQHSQEGTHTIPEGDDVRGIRLMCSLSHDAGVAVGVVIANQVDHSLLDT